MYLFKKQIQQSLDTTIMFSTRLLFLCSLLFLASLISATNLKSPESKILPPKTNNENGYLKQGRRVNVGVQQLVILFPDGNTPLVANQTSPLLIDVSDSTKSLLKSFNKATDTITTSLNFVCDGVIQFSVNSTLGERTDFTVDPNLIGICELVATAPDNSSEFAPSEPMPVVIESPVYYEGVLDTVLYTGQTIDNFLRAADNADIQVTLRISCDSGAQVVENMYWTNQPNLYMLPTQLIGECTFSTPVVPTNYVIIEPFTVSIEPNILFVKPTENQQYIAGTPIVAKLSSTNGGNPEVVVTLTCNDQFVDSQRKPLKSSFVFGANQKIYGSCVITVETSEPYYSESTVNVSISSTLTFKSPKKGQPIGAGTEYKLEVDGSSGTKILEVAVVGKCENGGNFEETVTLGVPKQVLMGQGFSGNCVLTANAIDAPNYSQATTNIVVFPVLTPDQCSKYARYFLMSGSIYSISRPISFIRDEEL